MSKDMALRMKSGCLLFISTHAFIVPAECVPTKHWTAVFSGATLIMRIYATYEMKYEMAMNIKVYIK